MNIRSRMLKVANNIIADYDYVYDPQHEKNPGDGYQRTEKGWSKDKTDRNEGGNGGKNERAQKNRVFLKKILMDNYYDEERSNYIASKFALDLAKGADKKKIVEQINNIISRNDIKISEKDLL